MLTPQKPADGISQIFNMKNMKAFKINCSCMNDEHSLTMYIENDEDTGEITINHELLLTIDYWEDKFNQMNSCDKFENSFLYSLNYNIRGFLNSLYIKCKYTYKLWFTPHITTTTVNTMTKQQALNYAHTIIDNINELSK